MSYVAPLVAVYQELVNAGGAVASDPSLPACIVGPLVNIVEADLDVATKKAGSLAATVDSLAASVTVNINSDTDFPGQVIDDASVEVVLEDVLVKTFAGTVDFSQSSPALETNDLGTVSTNEYGAFLPFAPNVRHVSLGDLVVISDTDGSNPAVATFVTTIDYTSGVFGTAIGFTGLSTSKLVTIYHKFSQAHAARNGWDADANELVMGLASSCYPDVARSLTTAKEYVFASEKDVNGGESIKVYIGYQAARKDTVNTIIDIADITDLVNKLGVIDPDNTLAFGVSLALQGSGGASVSCIATDPTLDEASAYTKALDLSDGRTLYTMVPLTTSLSIQAQFKEHVIAKSKPNSGDWRIALGNVSIPDSLNILGTAATPVKARVSGVSSGDGTATLTLTDGSDVGKVSSDDDLIIGSGDPLVFGSVGKEVIDASGYTLIVDNTTSPLSVSDAQIDIIVVRAATKRDQADYVAAQSSAWNSNRFYSFPGNVTIPVDGIDRELPGYYLLCSVAGQIAGLAPQQGLTKNTVPGVSNIVHGNFYFNQEQMNIMAEAGTILYAQNAQGTTPYCRHALSTDMSVLEYRELLKVKNWDYLSYYFKGILEPFLGQWNINKDTITNVRQTVVSASEQLKLRKLPRVGAPLVDYNIVKLEQSATSKDAMDIQIDVAIGDPNNYMNLYLVI